MKRARTERPENFEVDLSHPLMRGAVLLGLGQAHHSIRYRDESAKGNHGVLTNMDPATDWLWEPKLGRRVLDFDGSNDYVEIPSPGNVLDGKLVTFACWFNVPSGTATDYPRFIDRIYSGQFAFYWTTSTTIFAAALNTTGGAQDISNLGVSVPIGSWHHVVYVYNGADVLLYLDGLLKSTTSFPDGVLANSTAIVRIGQRVDAGTARNFLGIMADTCLWSRALSAAEINMLADPSNVMLSGAIREPRPRRSFVGQVAAKPWLYAHRRSSRVIGVGI